MGIWIGISSAGLAWVRAICCVALIGFQLWLSRRGMRFVMDDVVEDRLRISGRLVLAILLFVTPGVLAAFEGWVMVMSRTVLGRL